MKQKIYTLLHDNQAFIRFIYGLIILNVVALVLESYEGIDSYVGNSFYYFEVFSVVIFTIEYFLRIWTADLNPEYTGTSGQKRWKFIFSFYGIIDLLAIIPFYLPMIFTIDFRVLRMLRLFRLVRILKLGRFTKSIGTLNTIIKETRTELSVTLLVVFIFLVISSTLMFYIENEAQPDKFSSIGHAFWWAVATLTTVGYGDIYPVTPMGKFLSGIIALIGIGFIALPTGIISSAFIKKIQEDKQKKEPQFCECPNCGTRFQV